MTATNAILAKLDELFKEVDAKVLQSQMDWALKNNEIVANRPSMRSYPTYQDYLAEKQRLIEQVGGKTWFNVFDNYSTTGVIEFVEKNCANVAKKRNEKITKKLNEAGITEVISNEFTSTSDGFNGVFVVKCDTGEKCVTIQSILAGGYNIQCLHHRVLCKVK